MKALYWISVVCAAVGVVLILLGLAFAKDHLCLGGGIISIQGFIAFGMWIAFEETIWRLKS